MNIDIEMIFSYWQEIMQKPRAKMDDHRKKAIAGRLKDGYSVKDLMDAIQGCAWSRFHRGENDRQKEYRDIALICRDAYHVDDFIAIFERESAKQAKIQQMREASATYEGERREQIAKLRSIVGGAVKRMGS